MCFAQKEFNAHLISRLKDISKFITKIRQYSKKKHKTTLTKNSNGNDNGHALCVATLSKPLSTLHACVTFVDEIDTGLSVFTCASVPAFYALLPPSFRLTY
ncbi:hypothetical protein T03_4361 [Trichinella britovi]|uniref:Uncharacterized protein n=1 Tax=Trichinella britovi TaxID=45882 RepID=A0A0V1DHK3_TRIBR|nr:hypothetical protein T03_4361 [Trichinella britovi]